MVRASEFAFDPDQQYKIIDDACVRVPRFRDGRPSHRREPRMTNTSFSHGVPDTSWDVDLQRIHGHFLQSGAWCRFSAALGQPTYTARDHMWMWAATLRKAGPFRYLYAPYGPAAVDEAGTVSAVGRLREAAESLHCDFVRVEPEIDPIHWPPRARKVRSRQPDATWRLNLEPDEATLRKSLTKGHKGSINSAERKGLKLTRVNGKPSPPVIDEFLRLLHASEQRAKIESHSDDYFRTMISALPPESHHIYFAEHEDNLIATAMAFVFGDTAYYAYAGAEPSARQLSPAAPLVWKMILDAKTRGQKWFDFWGITTSEDPDHPWAGFTQFKRSFGGEQVTRAGTFDVVLRPARYTAYRIANKIRP